MNHPASDPVFRRFQATVKRRALWGPEDRLLVGISGGPDSVALAALARATGLPLGLAHVNYRLRGEDSDEDEALVRHLALSWDLPVWIGHPEIRKEAEKQGHSLQQAARHWRYSWWEELMAQEGYTRLLTGHQADDQAETLLLYLLRGSPRAGFQTIPYRRGAVCRPLLDLHRRELLDYLQRRGLPWREDRSNQTPVYPRNRIRLDLLPVMEQISPGIRNHLAQLAARQAAMLAAARHALEEQRPRFLKAGPDSLRLNLQHLQQEPWSLIALQEWLLPLGFHQDQIGIIDGLDPGHTGQRFQAGQWELTHDRGWLLGRRGEETSFEAYVLHRPGQTASTPWGELEILGPFPVSELWNGTPMEIAADADRMIWPLTLRTWHPGDRFIPFGMKGSKKVQDLLTDRKRDAFRKARTLVLCDGMDRILWVVGEQMSEQLRIREDSRQIYRLRWDDKPEGLV
jgi:tRNA(Ile)-lysidine synthase